MTNSGVNQNAFRPKSLEYDSLGGGVLRSHIRIAHGDPPETFPPIHVPVSRAGVVP